VENGFIEKKEATIFPIKTNYPLKTKYFLFITPKGEELLNFIEKESKKRFKENHIFFNFYKEKVKNY